MVAVLTRFSWLVVLIGMMPAWAAAQTNFELPPPPEDPAEVLTMLDEPGKAKLPILGRRFRIDFQIDQITLVFFRELGSAPVVLIQPDGTKWYAAKHPRENVTWHSQAEFDMITIDKPQPGPWQVSGRVLPDSSAMVVTEVQFHPDPIPNPLYAGETLKVSGRLTNGGKPIEMPAFRDVIKLDVIFISSNNPEYDNFGVDPTRVGEFRDDGRDLDEVQGDGEFTGSFKLNVRPGEYRPTYRVSTPLLQRSVQQDLVIVKPLPVAIEVEKAKTVDGDHKLLLTPDTEVIKPGSLVVNGRTLYPNAESEEWSVNTAQEAPYEVAIPSYAFGRYVITMDVFATDNNGREFIATAEAFEFIANEPPPPEPTAAERAERERLRVEAERAEQERLAEQQAQQMIWRVVIILLANILIIALAVGLWWWLRRRKAKSAEVAESAEETT
ncbi:TIGR03503 family protein [Pseudidiomarina planktonica]|uniref:TIGR03503 family protein n=2 Tax=Pseudidiomarina planktonica TaxID=1323738 RepID=A0A1Y6EW50_9GAMM|nr:TIGR03503 family protein [Pseudidiomarina planktonica]